MTTYYQFTPSPTGPYTFNPVLDGNSYTATVVWSVFGKHWMFNLNSPNGTLIVSRSLVGSPDGVAIENLEWAHGRVTVTTSVPHPFAVLGTFPITIQNSMPETYNGTRQCFVLSNTQFWYDAADDPGKVISFGQCFVNIDLIWGYFLTSTLHFNANSQQFEVNP